MHKAGTSGHKCGIKIIAVSKQNTDDRTSLPFLSHMFKSELLCNWIREQNMENVCSLGNPGGTYSPQTPSLCRLKPNDHPSLHYA